VFIVIGVLMKDFPSVTINVFEY